MFLSSRENNTYIPKYYKQFHKTKIDKNISHNKFWNEMGRSTCCFLQRHGEGLKLALSTCLCLIWNKNWKKTRKRIVIAHTHTHYTYKKKDERLITLKERRIIWIWWLWPWLDTVRPRLSLRWCLFVVPRAHWQVKRSWLVWLIHMDV